MRVRRIAWCGLAVLAGVAACSSGDGDDPDGSSRATAPVPVGSGADADGGSTRPAGRWTIVTVQLERSDTPDLEPGLAGIRLSLLDPGCDSGPCDIEGTPAGFRGTYLPEGVTEGLGASDPEPFTFEWDDASSTYTRTQERTTSCTSAALVVVAEAYDVTTVSTVAFRPAASGDPASLVGTYEMAVEATAAGEAAGCTAYEETGAVLGTPTGALGSPADLDLSGEYVPTETVALIEPAGEREPGSRGLLGPFVVEGPPGDHVITGLLGEPAPLAAADGGLSGAVERTGSCRTTPETPAGFTSTESWTGLEAVALTGDGEPILAGGWRLVEEPTAAGVSAGCSKLSNTGHVLLVPVGALR